MRYLLSFLILAGYVMAGTADEKLKKAEARFKERVQKGRQEMFAAVEAIKQDYLKSLKAEQKKAAKAGDLEYAMVCAKKGKALADENGIPLELGEPLAKDYLPKIWMATAEGDDAHRKTRNSFNAWLKKQGAKLLEAGDMEGAQVYLKMSKRYSPITYDAIKAAKKKIAALAQGKKPHPSAVRHGKRWYAWFGQRHLKTWDEAAKYCESIGGQLVIVNNEEENAFICTLATTKQCWLGADKRKGRWLWINGKRMKYAAWKAGEPNNAQGIEDAAALFQGEWYDVSRTSKMGFICEWK